MLDRVCKIGYKSSFLNLGAHARADTPKRPFDDIVRANG